MGHLIGYDEGMGICWHCYWGWPKQVATIYREAVSKLDGWNEGLTYGPGHIVWADENFYDDSIDFCLAKCDDPESLERWSANQIAISRESLLKLREVPESIRCEPEDYDDENPKNFPPAAGLIMERV